jgi:pimeloyl-ACP methyl ester carboxylesterase
MRRLLTVLVLILGLVACSTENKDYSLHLDEAHVDGPQTLGLSETDAQVKGLVVYFHGADQTARVIRDDEKHRNLFDSLLRQGYAVVAADAGGNAFGNPASRDDYRRLIVAARSKYGAVPVTFVAESMGALSALALLRENTDRTINGMVAISPLVGLPPQARAVSFIESQWDGTVPDAADPMTWPPQTFAHRKFRFYIPDGDHVVPSGATGADFAARFGQAATVQIVGCSGGHVDSACYQGADVEKWISGLD